MQSSSAQWVEIGMMAAGAFGLLILLAPGFGSKPKQTADGWCFPVKFSYLLFYWLSFAAGIGAVAFAGRRLLALGASSRLGWACFAFGFALVLSVLSKWPQPLIFDQDGLLRRGSPSTRIRWRELSYVRQYQVRQDRGIVIHSVHGKQLVVAETSYQAARMLDVLLEYHRVPLQSVDDELAPITIFKAQLPKPE
ncbi:MAG TPA: hypothetical protein VGM27_21745 [Acidobacteriaceae bacterium]